MKRSSNKFLHRVRIHGGEFDASARAMHRDGMTSSFQAAAEKLSIATNERKQMSTKTTFKRVALVTVAALGFGLISVAPASADFAASTVTAINITKIRTSQPTDNGVFCLFANVADGFEIAFRCNGKSGFDDIDAHLIKQLGNFQLFSMAHRGAGALFAVAQRGVEDNDAVFGISNCHGVSLSMSPKSVARAVHPLSARAQTARSEAG